MSNGMFDVDSLLSCEAQTPHFREIRQPSMNKEMSMRRASRAGLAGSQCLGGITCNLVKHDDSSSKSLPFCVPGSPTREHKGYL